MPEPTTAAALTAAARTFGTQAGKRLFAPGVRLGGREERRLVYARFVDAAIDEWSCFEYMRLMRPAFKNLNFQAPESKEIMKLLTETGSELLKAHAELRLAGNEEPLRASFVCLGKLDALSNLAERGSDEEWKQAQEEIGQANRDFVDACRHDLMYTPRAWQLWRWARWRAIWANWQARRLPAPAPVPELPAPR